MERKLTRLISATIAGALIVAAGNAGAQQAEARVTGRVTNAQGAPIGGATVSMLEFQVGAATSENGNYSFVVPARATGRPVRLTARFIGFTPITRTVTVAPGATLTENFQLAQDPLRLNEVVVTGVAEATSTRKLGFAVGRVDEAQIQEVPALNPVSALTGKVSGARVATGSGVPGGETTVRLRSATSLSPGATQAPLLIVDGVITKGSLSDINVQDIESMEVLKGPASAGIYGSDAAAGVLSIITKRGRNAPEGRTLVTLRNEYGMSGLGRRLPINQSTNCIDRVTLPNGQTDFPRTAEGRVNCTNLSPFYDQAYPTAAPFRDQQDQLLGNGQFYTNYVSMARRQGTTNFQASFENQQNEGIIEVPGVNINGFGRRNFRFNLDQFVRDNLDFSVGAFYNTSKNQLLGQGVGSPFFGVLFMPPDVDLTAENTNGTPFFVGAGRLGATPSTDRNPLYTIANENQREDRTRIQGNFRGRYRPTDWLSFDANYAYDRSTNQFRNVVPKNTLSASGVRGGGGIGIQNFAIDAQNANFAAAINQRFGELGTITRGVYWYEDELRRFDADSGQNFSAAGVPTLDNTALEGRQFTSFEQRIRARSYMGQLSLDFRDRYILDGLVRRDGSSLFGPDARYRTFYRATAAYRLTEDFKLPGINELRLRASRGTAGLRPPFAAQYETFTTAGGSITPGVLGNRNLRPAYATENELGLNLDFLNRFSLEYTYSDKVTRDQVLLVPLSAVAGFSRQWQNAATLDGNTHEIGLGLVLAERPTFSWRVNLTADRTRQRVTQLSAPSFRLGAGCGAAFGSACEGGAGQSSDIFLVRQGETYGTMWGSRWVRSFAELQRNPTYANANADDYVVNPDGLLVLKANRGTAAERAIRFADEKGNSLVQIGDANPNFNAGFSSNMTWRGFTVYGLLDHVNGGDIYNLPRQWLARSEFRSGDLDQGGKPDDRKLASAYYAGINDANNFSDYFVEPGGYTRLRELSVNYTFGTGLLQATRLDRLTNRLRVGIVGRNLVTWTKYSGLDPETSAVGAVQGTGVANGVGDATTFRFDGFGYPNFRTFSAVVEIGF